MRPTQFWKIAERSKDFRVNISLLGGAVLRDYEIVRGEGCTASGAGPLPLVELGQEDRAPIFVDIECIAAVELAGAGSAFE